jgi:hypothetical protein
LLRTFETVVIETPSSLAIRFMVVVGGIVAPAAASAVGAVTVRAVEALALKCLDFNGKA